MQNRAPARSSPSIVPSWACAVTDSPSPDRPIPWWWWERTCGRSPTISRSRESATVTTSCSPQLASSRRWGAWSVTSSKCWTSVPPQATFRSWMPRQIPSTGRSRSSAPRSRPSSAPSRRWCFGPVRGMGLVAVQVGSDVLTARDDEAVEHVQDVAWVVRPERVGRQDDRATAAEADALDVPLGDERGIERPRVHDGVAPVAGDADRRPAHAVVRAHARPGPDRSHTIGAPAGAWLSRPRPAPGRSRAAPRRPSPARLRRADSRRRRSRGSRPACRG